MIFIVNPPVWRFPRLPPGKIIIALDKQKVWERVANYRDRVIQLCTTQKMSERYDNQFMTRIFLGGLRPQVLDLLLHEHSLEFTFRSAAFDAELMELAIIQTDPEYANGDGNYIPLAVLLNGNQGAANGGGQGEAMDIEEEEEGAVGGYVGGQLGAPNGDGANDDWAIAAAAVNGFEDWPEMLQGTNAMPSVIQEGEEFFGLPNPRVDRLFNAKYILVLYR